MKKILLIDDKSDQRVETGLKFMSNLLNNSKKYIEFISNPKDLQKWLNENPKIENYECIMMHDQFGSELRKSFNDFEKFDNSFRHKKPIVEFSGSHGRPSRTNEVYKIYRPVFYKHLEGIIDFYINEKSLELHQYIKSDLVIHYKKNREILKYIDRLSLKDIFSDNEGKIGYYLKKYEGEEFEFFKDIIFDKSKKEILNCIKKYQVKK